MRDQLICMTSMTRTIVKYNHDVPRYVLIPSWVYLHTRSRHDTASHYNFCCHSFSLRTSIYFPLYQGPISIIQIMHIREVVSKNYSPQGNFIKVGNTRGWKPRVFWLFIKLPRVDNFTNDRSPNVHYLFYKIVSKIWAVISKN